MNSIRLALVVMLMMGCCVGICDEILVSVTTWDVIVAKPDDSVWSATETNGQFYCVKWIEDEFAFPADPNANIVYPYAVYSNHYPHGDVTNLSSVVAGTAGAKAPIRNMVKRSEYQCNPSAVSKKDKKLKKNSKDFGKDIKPK